MRLKFLLLGLLLANSVLAKERKNAIQILQKTSDVLNNLKSISYKSYREINNFKDNYFSKNSGSSYFEFDDDADGKVARFQLRSADALQVFNGTEYFYLNEKEKSLELEKRTPKQLTSISLLYNSLTTLRLSLPMVISDTSIHKSITDTILDGKTYDMIKFGLNRKSMEYPMGFSHFDSEVIKFYKLIIDKKTAFPYIVYDGNSISKDLYHTKTIFTDINLSPVLPKETSWYYSSYAGYEHKKKATRKPMVTVNSLIQNWSLPQYVQNKVDTLSMAGVSGKIIIMEFWIKNCGYCMQAFPEIRELQKKYGDKIEILSINAYDKKEEIDFFYKREKPAYKMLYSGEKLAESLGIYSYPTTLILDGSGKVIYSSAGFDKVAIEQIIKTSI